MEDQVFAEGIIMTDDLKETIMIKDQEETTKTKGQEEIMIDTAVVEVAVDQEIDQKEDNKHFMDICYFMLIEK